MNKYIMITLSSMLALQTVLFAFPNEKEPGRMMPPPPQQNQHHNEASSVQKLFGMLELTKEQRNKIETFRKESFANQPDEHEAFSDKSFDKEKYITLIKAKKEAKLVAEADVIEKIYSILTEKQKNDFKTILDMQKILKQKKKKH
ncbi:MAG: Spy/CpxP family protein refolding chaperone [Epsilonproteobacteria bacterium]|nr:Spy/CpxP family protein refolding chaperone [Campylobacterota bacterium]